MSKKLVGADRMLDELTERIDKIGYKFLKFESVMRSRSKNNRYKIYFDDDMSWVEVVQANRKHEVTFSNGYNKATTTVSRSIAKKFIRVFNEKNKKKKRLLMLENKHEAVKIYNSIIKEIT